MAWKPIGTDDNGNLPARVMTALGNIFGSKTDVQTAVNTAGTALSNLGGQKIVKIAKADYQALPTPHDTNTIYVISDWSS